MAAGRVIPILILCGVVVVSHLSMSGLARANGTIYLPDVLKYKNRILAGTDNVSINFPRSGLEPVDNAVAFMIAVFWSVLDPKHVRGHIQGHHFLGGLSAAWILMLMECHRANRSQGFIIFTYFMEVVGELIGVGLSTPVWCIIHLIMTAAPGNRDVGDLRDHLPRASSLGSLGYAYFFGHVVPTGLMSFLKHDAQGLQSQQFWIIVRLFHPVLILFLWKAFSTFESRKNDTSNNLRAAASRKFYTFAILSSAFHHASAMSLIYAEHWIPGYVKPEITKALSFKSTLLPFPFWRHDLIKPVPFAEGVTTFLQWDETMTIVTMLIWSTTLYLETSRTTRSNSGRISLFLQTVLIGLVGGPVAPAAYIMQERDNLVLDYLETAARKTV